MIFSFNKNENYHTFQVALTEIYNKIFDFFFQKQKKLNTKLKNRLDSCQFVILQISFKF